ncbi:branched-chain amino acid aminotransferase [Propionicicella superfundia]|uniref:branched-chain amino acid aminotransferase n=1 Tax=Propionicicella superfundia TaxID=348582 RepID=UPI000425682E|nr:branched-chain amino acid aminotransferase [Propionicicella superfundia]
MAFDFALTRNPAPATPARLQEILADPGFGVHFTDHMVTAEWTHDAGWQDAVVEPYGPVTLQPHAAVLHYGQEIFEGLKAYRHEDGSVWLFRPEKNAERFERSAARLMLPILPAADFVSSVTALVEIDERWVPSAAAGEYSLYLRPFMYASEAFLGVHPAQEVTYRVIASPVGPYFATGAVEPVDIWVTTTYSRAGAGGTGAAKCGGNYASGLIAQQEGYAHGCSQVLFADAASGSLLEELGGMNLFLVTADGQLLTPELSGSILEGVTRDSILVAATELGLTPVERKIELAELFDGLASGHIVETFACGTAAVLTPIGSFRDEEHTWAVGTGSIDHTLAIRTYLTDVQYGRRPDTHGWLTKVV